MITVINFFSDREGRSPIVVDDIQLAYLNEAEKVDVDGEFVSTATGLQFNCNGNLMRVHVAADEFGELFGQVGLEDKVYIGAALLPEPQFLCFCEPPEHDV